MIEDKFSVGFSGALLAFAVAGAILLLSHQVNSLMPIGILIHIGIVICGFKLFWRLKRTHSDWKGAVPKYPRIFIPVAMILGAILIFLWIQNFTLLQDENGRTASRVSMNYDGGKCMMSYDRRAAVSMPNEVCSNMEFQLSLAFCGFWLFFSGAIHWISLKTRYFSLMKK